MDLKQLDIDQLSTLWKASYKNLELQISISQELELRIATNTNFSIEYIFQVCKIANHAITISFIPTSVAYQNYGESVTIDILLDKDEMQKLITNYSSKPPVNTFGQVKAKNLVDGNLNHLQIELLSTLGFNTNEILETIHL